MKIDSKKNRRSGLAAACIGLATLSAPDATAALRLFGGQGSLEATAQVSRINGIDARRGGESDTSYAFIPTFGYVRDRSRLKLRGDLSMPVTRYSSATEYDSEDVIFNFSGNLPYDAGPRVSGGWNVRFFDGVQSDYFVNSQVERSSFTASANAKYRLLRRMSLRASASYDDSQTDAILGEIFSDTKTTTYAVGVERSQVFKDVGVYADYRITNRESGGQRNSSLDDTDSSIVFGLNGQILPERLFPKLEADLSFGIARTNDLGDRGEDENRLTLNGRLSYPATQKTRLSLNFGRRLSVTADDRTVESSDIDFSIQTSPRRNVALSANIGYSVHEFLDGEVAREDKVLSGGINASYSMRQWWRFNAGYTIRSSDSNVAVSDFDRSTLSVSTTFIY